MTINEFTTKARMYRVFSQEEIAWFFSQDTESIKKALMELAKDHGWKGFGVNVQKQILALNKEEPLKLFVQWYICTTDFTTRPYTIRLLCKEAQIRLLEIPGIADVVKAYAAHHEVCDEAMDKLFAVKENFDAYIWHRRLTECGFCKLMELDPEIRDKLLYTYIMSHHLHEPQELLMVKKLLLQNPKLLQYYNEKYGFCNKVQGYMNLCLLSAVTSLSLQVGALDSLHRPLGPTTLDQA